MKVQLNSKNYNSKIKIYYQDESYCIMAEEIIGFVWLKNIPLQAKEKFELVKKDMKGKVYKYKSQTGIYYLKCYSHRRTSKIVKNLFRPVEGIRHFKTAKRLMGENIPVVEPVLSLTYKQNPFITDSIFITKAFEGINLVEGLQIAGNNKSLRQEIIKQVAKIFGQLSRNKFLNQDPSLFNILIDYIDQDKEIFKLSLVDVDNIYTLPILPVKLIIANLSKFCARVLADIYRGDIKQLDFEERLLFLAEFFNSVKLEVNIEEIGSIITQNVINILIQSGNREVVINDIVWGNSGLNYKK